MARRVYTLAPGHVPASYLEGSSGRVPDAFRMSWPGVLGPGAGGGQKGSCLGGPGGHRYVPAIRSVRLSCTNKIYTNKLILLYSLIYLLIFCSFLMALTLDF